MNKFEKTISRALTSLITSVSARMTAEGVPAHIAETVEADFIVIDRAELPETTVKDGHVVIEDADSMWPIRSLNIEGNYRWALQYLAAGEAVAKARAEGDAKLNGRRNALSIDFGLHAPYDALPVSHQRMIDYIIKLEGPKIIESEDAR